VHCLAEFQSAMRVPRERYSPIENVSSDSSGRNATVFPNLEEISRPFPSYLVKSEILRDLSTDISSLENNRVTPRVSAAVKQRAVLEVLAIVSLIFEGSEHQSGMQKRARKWGGAKRRHPETNTRVQGHAVLSP